MGFSAITLLLCLSLSLSVHPDGIPFSQIRPFLAHSRFLTHTLSVSLSKTDDYMQPKNGAGGLNGDIFLKFAQNKHFMVIFIGILSHWTPFACTQYTHSVFRFAPAPFNTEQQCVRAVWAAQCKIYDSPVPLTFYKVVRYQYIRVRCAMCMICIRIYLHSKSTIHVFVSVRLLKLRVTFLKCICLFDLLFCSSVVIFFFSHSLSLFHYFSSLSLVSLSLFVSSASFSFSRYTFSISQNGWHERRKAKTNARQYFDCTAFYPAEYMVGCFIFLVMILHSPENVNERKIGQRQWFQSTLVSIMYVDLLHFSA